MPPITRHHLSADPRCCHEQNAVSALLAEYAGEAGVAADEANGAVVVQQPSAVVELVA